jgi:hypothetical protein
MMASTFLITVANSVRTRKPGPATGDIWVVIDGREFPMCGWNDFVVVILNFWTTALMRLIRNDSKSEIVDFMDGPHCVVITMTTPTTLRLRALEGDGRRLKGPVGEVPVEQIILELTSQSHEILAECKKQGWWSKDADILLSSITELEKQIHTEK